MLNSNIVDGRGDHYSRAALATLPLPEPRGPIHAPFPFGEFADLVYNAMEPAGYNVVAEDYLVTEDRNRLFGVIELESENGVYSRMVGLRGSHDMTLGRSLAVGSRVYVCSNLAFSGDVVLTTKQTTHLGERLSDLVYEAVDKLGGLFGAQDRLYERFQETWLDDKHADALLTQFVRRGVLPTSHLGMAIKEWDDPSHDHGERTAWRMHNAITEVMKRKQVNPMMLNLRTQRMNSLISQSLPLPFEEVA